MLPFYGKPVNSININVEIIISKNVKQIRITFTLAAAVELLTFLLCKWEENMKDKIKISLHNQ